MKPNRHLWFIFVALLLIHVILISILYSPELSADEGRYLSYAENITNGFYTDHVDPVLRNGPGYPLFLAMLLALGAGKFIMVISNALFIVVGTVCLYRALNHYLLTWKSVAVALVASFYPVILKWEYLAVSESFTYMLSCLFVYHLVTYYSYENGKNKHLVYGSVFLGVLSLTKVIFGYVLLIGVLSFLILGLLTRTKLWKAPTFIFCSALIVCVPYLIYTYSLTGKIFYWGSQGGEILYWRTTPYPEEYGDWVDGNLIIGQTSSDQYNDLSKLKKNHGEFYSGIANLPNVEKDKAFKAQAVNNIKKHPSKYLRNTFASALRIFYNYPYSYTPQKLTTFLYILPNTFLLVAMTTSILLLALNYKVVKPEVVLLLGISLIYLVGICLLNGKPRHFLPILPLSVIFVSFSLERFLFLKKIK